MKTVVFFVFLAFALVLCHQDVQKTGAKKSLGPCAGTGSDTDKALTNLLKKDTVINKPPVNRLKISHLCITDMNSKRTGDASTGIHCDFLQSCYVVGLSDLTVYVKSKQAGDKPQIPGSEQCAILPPFQAAFLVQDDSANTYMILDPEKAHWFFTRPLGGCDIFVATAAGLNKRHTPIVIHSNLNSCGNKLQNLEMKGDSVDQLLLRHPGYKLNARVYSAPPPGPDRHQANAHFQTYKSTHPGIQIIAYDNHKPLTLQSFQFIGHYNEDQFWIFTLKGEVDGRIVAQFPVII